jgi:amino acid permease
MDISAVIAISTVFLLVSVGLLVSHVRSWRQYQQQELSPDERNYRWRQFRRRMQTSAMLGLMAVALAVGYVLTLWLKSGWFAAIYWSAVLFMVLWIALLAMADIWATKFHFGRQRQNFMVEQAKLQAELRRLQSIRGNGKPKTSPGEKKSESQG